MPDESFKVTKQPPSPHDESSAVPPVLPLSAESCKPSLSAVAWAVTRIVVGVGIMLVPVFVGGPASMLSFAMGGWLLGGGGYDLYKLYNR